MRFKGVVHRKGIHALSSLSSTILKFTHEYLFHLSLEGVELRKIIESQSKVELFAKFTVDVFFEELTLVSKNNNEISLLIEIKHLVQALKSVEYENETIFKLTRKESIPYLTICADTLIGLTVTHDVPIKQILSGESVLNYQEPKLDKPSIHCSFPHPKYARTSIERLASLNKYIYLDFNPKRDTLVLRIQNTYVCVRTILSKC